MEDELRNFKQATLVRRVVSRFVEAKEFPSDKALKKYLEDHPQADKSKHTVREHKTPTQFKRDDRKRWQSVLTNIDGWKDLEKKALDGDEEAGKEVTKRFHALYEHGTSLADDAKPLLKKLKGSSTLSDKGKQHLAALDKALKEWDKAMPRFEKAKGRNTRAQVEWAKTVVGLASSIRTFTHWLQDEAVQNKAIKRAADEWRA